MKTTSRRWGTIITLMVGMVVLVGFLIGCSKDDETSNVGPESSKIKIEQLIFNPKSPAPGDTMQATAVVTASTPNVGDYVEYTWTATDGTFLESNKSSVRWVAPTNSGIFTLSCAAKNSVSSANGSDDVFVGQLEDFIETRAGELHPRTVDDWLYYLAPTALDSGLVVHRKNMSTGDDEVVFADEDRAGNQYTFDSDITQAAHMVPEGQFRPRLNVVHDDLQNQTQTVIARDERPFPFRPNEFTRPYVSSDATGIAYQGALLDQELIEDTFTVFIHDIAAGTSQRCTFEGDNFFPSFSSDNQHLIFVSNREGTFDWEYYALPVSGMVATVDTIQGALVKLTNSGGLFGSESIPPEPRPYVWNPNPAFPVMAVIANNDRLWLVPADGGGDILVDITGKIGDMTWSSDGSQLAVTSFDGDLGLGSIHLVSPSGDPVLLHQGSERDRLGAPAWSPDNKFLVYTVDRGDIWYELFDVEGSSLLTQPARITPAWVAGEAADYGPPLMSLRSSFRPGTLTAYLFFLDRSTPRVRSIDLSGVNP